jgi:hypothetical protein
LDLHQKEFSNELCAMAFDYFKEEKKDEDIDTKSIK